MPPVREVVVTSFGADGAVLGERCVESLKAYWPATLVVYRDHGDVQPLTKWRDVIDRLPSENPRAEKPTNYIWNAKRFAIKPFVWLDAAEVLGQGIVTWLDSDTIIKQRVPVGFVAGLLSDFDVVYLGRGDMHPETGFVSFRIPEALPLLRWCVACYTTGAFQRFESGWTDCHVLRASMHDVRARDLTSHLRRYWTSRDDAFADSPLGPYVDHLKGPKRKREAMTV